MTLRLPEENQTDRSFALPASGEGAARPLPRDLSRVSLVEGTPDDLPGQGSSQLPVLRQHRAVDDHFVDADRRALHPHSSGRQVATGSRGLVPVVSRSKIVMSAALPGAIKPDGGRLAGNRSWHMSWISNHEGCGSYTVPRLVR